MREYMRKRRASVGRERTVVLPPELADRLKVRAEEAGFELSEYAVRVLTRFVSSANVSNINEVNTEAETLEALRRELDELKCRIAALEAVGAPTPELDQDLTEEWLVRWYSEDLPRREGLRSLPIPWTWKRYAKWCEARGVQPNTDRFHQLLKSMAMRSRIALTAHDNPRNLPAEEAAILRKDPEGRTIYYWTVLT
jgi:hypothetical protein